MVYNICTKHRKIPSEWKRSQTVLVYKKGNPKEVKNYRPISLLRTITKLYTGLLTTRLSKWVGNHSVLSPGQKGFRPYDGVFEHQYALSRYLERTKRKKTELCVAWLDTENAFGSIPHSALTTALRRAGTDEAFVEIVTDLYTGCSATVKSTHGVTAPIVIEAGVRQGCPLSGLLFNLAIDLLRRQDDIPSVLELSPMISVC